VSVFVSLGEVGRAWNNFICAKEFLHKKEEYLACILFCNAWFIVLLNSVLSETCI
jgi:hypothetical protein